MSRKPTRESAVLTLRVPAALDRRLAQEAARRRRSRGQTARDILAAALTSIPDPAAEARRQSRLASRRHSEQDALDFIASAADLRGWK